MNEDTVLDTAAKSSDPAQAKRRTRFEPVALLLQGGGALGSYQLAKADLHPDWVAGISIGAINSALIAGNPPEKRVQRLRDFWETVCASPLGVPYFKSIDIHNDLSRQFVNQARAMSILMFGAPHFFTPRLPPALLWPGGSADEASYYDNTPLRATLERLVDFGRINSGEMCFSVGAVNVRSGNFTCFDTATHRIAPAHVIASGSLRPDAAAIKAPLAAPNFLLKIVPHVDGTPRICELVEYQLLDVDLKGAWTGPAALSLVSHALAPLAELPVLEIVSGTHIVADLTLGLGKVVHDYLA